MYLHLSFTATEQKKSLNIIHTNFDFGQTVTEKFGSGHEERRGRLFSARQPCDIQIVSVAPKFGAAELSDSQLNPQKREDWT